MSQGAVSKKVNGDRPFSLDELDAVAHYFGVPVQSLFDPPRAHPFRGISRSDVTHELARPRCVTHGLKVAA